MACFFSMPFSNNPYITPWGTIGIDGKSVEDTGRSSLYHNYGMQSPGDRYPYHVQPGDTLYGIARRLEARLSDIIASNPGLDHGRLGIGQTIYIPACPPEHAVRYIQPGDTLGAIAKIYETSIETILEANPGTDPNYLRIGQRLCIPQYSRMTKPHTGV